MIKNVLITGINGFVGSNLYNFYSKKFQLFGLDVFNNNDLISSNKFYYWNGLHNIPDVDIIIHLAGKAHDIKNTSSEQEYFDVNVGLTKKIFQHFLKSSASKFIFFSSVKAVADSISDEILTEEMLPNPQTPYGKSKLQAEQYILSMHLPPEKRVYILRPCMIHGPGNKGNLNLLYKLTKKGLPWPLGAFDNKRSFTSMQNLQFVIQEFIEKDIESGTYQIADDETLSTNELICLIADSLDKKAHIWNISPNMIKLIAKTGDKLGLPLNTERLKKLTESYIVSNQKLKKTLGIEKMPHTAAEGMKKTFSSFL
ncbi:MAG: NAD-dependent epimerase/dehydratase family protein [Bacteroidia bacterium]|nr:NAD-dependent epimerase/dehydratase family protein [Bacteroidia bacterium]